MTDDDKVIPFRPRGGWVFSENRLLQLGMESEDEAQDEIIAVMAWRRGMFAAPGKRWRTARATPQGSFLPWPRGSVQGSNGFERLLDAPWSGERDDALKCDVV
jgi:hypothetical protein